MESSQLLESSSDSYQKILRLIRVRFLVIGIIFFFVILKYELGFIPFNFSLICILLFVESLLNFFYLFWLHTKRYLFPLVLLQLIVDSFLFLWGIYLIGSWETPFCFLIILPVLLGSFVFDLKKNLVLATWLSLLVGFLWYLELYGFIKHINFTMIKSFKEPTFLFFCYKLGGIIWLIFLVVILCENFRKVTERKEFELIRQVKESHNLQKCMIEIERCIFGDESIKGAFCALQDFSTEIKQALPILKRIFSGNDADTRKITIDLKKAIERIESSRDYLLKLTKNLDDLSCLNGVAYSLIDLNKLLKQIVCQKMLNSKEIKFKMSLDENLPLIEADSNLLKCLAINLLENSKEAILGNGTIKITTRHLSKNDAVEIIFSDTGNGIKAEEKESISKIFKPFYTTKENSDGLGLTIVKEIVSLHKGKISVKKNKDETSFVIELPVYQTNFMQTLSFKDPAVLLAEL